MIYKPSKPFDITVAASNAPAWVRAIANYVCDGTDDDVQINAAINATGTGRVYLSSGTFTIGSTITLQNNIKLEGQGFNTIITCKNSFTDHMLTVSGKTGVSLSNFKIDGNKTNQTFTTFDAKSLIYVYNSSFSGVENLFLYNGIAAGIQYKGNAAQYTGLSIRGCKLSTLHNGILLSTYGEYCRISDCVINTVSQYGINIAGAGNVTVNNAQATQCSIAGINVDSNGTNPTKITVSNSHFNHNAIGIVLKSVSRVSIVNCNAISNTQDGIKLIGASYCSVIGGTVGANSAGTHNTYSEIKLMSDGSTHSLNNIIQGVAIDSYVANPKAQYSINEDTNSNYNLFAHNIGRAGQTGGINKIGANSVLDNNLIA